MASVRWQLGLELSGIIAGEAGPLSFLSHGHIPSLGFSIWRLDCKRQHSKRKEVLSLPQFSHHLETIMNECVFACAGRAVLSHFSHDSTSGLTLCDPMNCSPPGSSVHGDSPGKNTGVGCHALLQRLFPIQGSNLCLLILRYWHAGFLTTSATWEALSSLNKVKHYSIN